MKTVLCLLSVAILAFSFTGCSSTKGGGTFGKDHPAEYCQDGITMDLKTDPMLNLYQGKQHALVLCVYQMKDPNEFNQLLGTNDGFSKLMECNRFDPSIEYTRSIIVQPGQHRYEMIDRAEKAQYLGVVAGYFLNQNDHHYRLLRIPAGVCKKNMMNIKLFLGPQFIQEASDR